MAEANSQLNDEERIAEGTLIADVSQPPAPHGNCKSGKRDRLGHLNNSEVAFDITDSLFDETNKKVKRELPSNSLSPNSTNKSKRHQRNYRARIMESSSEDESSSCPASDNTKEATNSELEVASENLLNDANNIQTDKFEAENANITEAINTLDDLAKEVTDKTEEKADLNNSNTSSRTQETEASSTSQMETSQSSTAVGSNVDNTSTTTPPRSRLMRNLFSNFPSNDTDSDTSLDDEEDSVDADRKEKSKENRVALRKKLEKEATKEMASIMNKEKPKHKWNSLLAVLNRPYGMSGNRQTGALFMHRYYDSLHVAQRLELVSKLDFHNGCTNALNFNESGDLLASSSDDLQIAVWDWMKEKTLVTYNSGHRNNVFQCKFLPLTGNTHIVSCARDGQVRLAEITSSGVCRDTRRLAKHSKSAHKLTTRLNTPYEIMSAGEDAFVYNIDIRTDQPEKIVLVKNIHGNRVPLYSIHQHPLNDNQFCVSGQDQYVRIFDRRIISPFGPPVLKYCPNHLLEKKPKSNITCAVYSNNGDAILASYNDENIYLFDTSLSEGAAPAHTYSGHRNISTVKGVNFFSPSSRYIVSGSDCGNVFVWDRETEAIVNCMPGDENGVVNVLEPHPHLPVLATSGLDHEIKIWVPTGMDEPKLSNLEKTIWSNVLQRLRESNGIGQGLDTHMLMVLFQHLRRIPSFRGRPRSGSQSNQDDGLEDDLGMLDSSEESSSDDNDSDDSDANNRGELVQCSTQ